MDIIIDIVQTFLKTLETILSSMCSLSLVSSMALLFKATMLYLLVKYKNQSPFMKKIVILLIIFIIGSMSEDVAWLSKVIKMSLWPTMNYPAYIFIIRLSWVFVVVRYHALSLFIENLINPQAKINLAHKILLCCSGIVILFFICIMIFNGSITSSAERWPVEVIVMRLIPTYLQLTLYPLLIYTVIRLKKLKIPRILQRQITIALYGWITPTFAIDFLQSFPFGFTINPLTWVTNSYTFVTISNVLLMYMTFLSAKRLLNIRFLNINNHVTSTSKFTFIDDLKEALGKLGCTTTIREIEFVTQELFHKAFAIPSGAVTIKTYGYNSEQGHTSKRFDLIFKSHQNFFLNDVDQTKILIYDEIAFNNYYENTQQLNNSLKFLEILKADIYIPINYNQKAIGCIVIEANAHPHKLYSKAEHDEMMVFASYLGNVVHLMANRNLEAALLCEKEMREELYSKHLQINQYKESIRFFFRNQHQQKIGLIMYKSRQFVFANKEAKELISINLNTQKGHPLTQACKKVVDQVILYKSAQKCVATINAETKLVINGIAQLDSSQVTLVIYHPEPSDVILKQIDQLKDPSLWDYLLYLETTQIGKLVNQLIPGNSDQLLNFKIELLKASLSSKALLLDIPNEDLLPTVELLHHINLRTSLHIITLKEPQKNQNLAVELFGINALFETTTHEPLLKKLNNCGTLCIQNIHFMDKETQNYLAEFIRYGFYRPYKSEEKIFSNVRIIVSSSQKLAQLVHDGIFSEQLFKELQETTLSFPNLTTLKDNEINDLIHGFASQALTDHTLERILEFNEHDRKKIMKSCPNSIAEFRRRIQSLLAHKSKENNLCSETMFNPSYQVSDPELASIAHLGKHALKNEKAMIMLWNKFKNQNKIATFLGVNRSSVNRRCKDYNLQ